MAEIASILGIANSPQLSAFGEELQSYGLETVEAIKSVPNSFPQSSMDVSLTRRIEWLEDKIINPSQKLISALQPENQPHFKVWPKDRRMPKRLFGSKLLSDIARLQANAKVISDILQENLDDKINTTSELRYSIVFNLLAIASEHFPALHLSRGTYDKKLKQMIGQTPAYVRRGFFEITGLREQLDEPIAQVLKSL